ncbi:MFS transporter [Pseudomonas leptonychotis]|uniref:MFS transporter n=1 Tax=Pseudomonas leptonychotis TaxID=2448482 RepID=UPI00386F50DA
MVGLVYAGLGIFSVFGNVLMPAASRQLGGSRRLMRVALGVCLVLCLLVFARLSTPLWLVLMALMLWALVGGLGSPALQSHIAQLSPARRGALIALGMSMMHVGVAVSSAVSGLAYAASPQWVAVVGLVLFGLAILALRPISQTCVCSSTPS